MYQQGLSSPVSLYDPSRAYNGYTLYATVGQKNMWLVDMHGNFVHRWNLPRTLGMNAVLLTNGNLMAGVRVPGGPIEALPGAGEEIVELDWDGNVVWKYEDLYMNSHEQCRMDSGNTMITRWKPVPDDLARRIQGGTPGTEHEGQVWTDVLREISPEGEVLWELPFDELLDPEVDTLCPLCPRETWTYINSVVVLPDDNILVCLRLINTLAIIDKKARKIKWRWGRDVLGHPHNPTLLDNGNILLFDNGHHNRSSSVGVTGFTRVLEVNPETDDIEWEYTDKNLCSFFSSLGGGAQRLPNGNTLICEAVKGRIFEVTPDKRVVWEFVNPFYFDYPRGGFGWTNAVYRAMRYGPDHPALQGKELNPDRYVWALQEKGESTEGIASAVSEDMDEKMRKRLEALGY